jgi:hypothetical protein
MTGYLTYMAAREHANDLLCDAEASRRVRPIPPPRLGRFRFLALAIPRTVRAATVGS